MFLPNRPPTNRFQTFITACFFYFFMLYSSRDWSIIPHYSMMSFLVVLFVVAVTAADPAPCVVNWNKDRTYGPDGPWQVRTIVRLVVTST